MKAFVNSYTVVKSTIFIWNKTVLISNSLVFSLCTNNFSFFSIFFFSVCFLFSYTFDLPFVEKGNKTFH